MSAREQFETEHDPSARPGLRDWWEIAFDYYDECVELVEEVQALDEENLLLTDFVVGQRYAIDHLRAENERLTALVALAEARKTLGGIPRGTTPDWSPNPKLAGEQPPPYSPAISTEVITSE